jgi:putative hydrolase
MRLEEMADLLEQQDANRFRVNAYRRAAASLADLHRDVDEILDNEGREGLIALPDIGKGIATAIAEIVATGRWSQLERLRGSLDPAHLFQTVPGIGPELAQRIHDGLHIDTLEALEMAAHDGRLATVKGVGTRRLNALRASLASMLGRTHRVTPIEGPGVKLVLEIDRTYQERTAAGLLPLIAPKRFNPEGKVWLPILHTDGDGWHFTAMYSNTARAHQLGRIDDWVVIYFYDHHHREGQYTVVTETRGPLIGKRVIRGRENECRDCYSS